MTKQCIVINGINSHTGGGKSILWNYMRLLNAHPLHDRYVLLTARPRDFSWIVNPNIQVLAVATTAPSYAMPLYYEYVLPRILKRHEVDLVFNLGNLIIATPIPQIYLFHWPYFLEQQGVVWDRMRPLDRLQRRIKIRMMEQRISEPVLVFAQTPRIARVLRTRHGIQKVAVLPGAALDSTTLDSKRRFTLPAGRKLLYLTHYYVHKNIEILLPLARLIQLHRLQYRLVLTISSAQHPSAKAFLKAVHSEGLDDILINIGPVSSSDVPALYSECDALLMPTLLETFGLPYVEAMHHRLPILTSDLEFARDVCGAAAIYFDPFSAEDILRKARRLMEDHDLVRAVVMEGERRIASMPTWEEIFNRIQTALYEELNLSAA